MGGTGATGVGGSISRIKFESTRAEKENSPVTSRGFITSKTFKVVATYISTGHTMQICNAGHPQPLLYRRATQSWSFAGTEQAELTGAYNLPLGILETTAYQQFRIDLSEGDVLVFYTDAVTEASGPDGSLLAEAGLLRLVAGLKNDDVQVIGHGLLKRLNEFTHDAPSADDLTLMVVRYSRDRRRFPGILERLNR